MEVSDVLRERMQQPGGLPVTAAVSFLAHAAVLGALIVGPMRWMSNAIDENKPVMTISLGGSAGTGPENGGMNSIGARAVQTTEQTMKPEALRAPAMKTPEMTVPLDKTPAKTTKAPPKATETIAKLPDARGKTLARGEEINTSPAVAVTGARGQGFGGLSTGGGNGLSPTLDVGDFCCPDYIVLMNARIQPNWNRQQEVKGYVTVKFTIQRDGRLVDLIMERSSGVAALDNAARRAIEVTRQLAPLPAAYTNPALTIHLTFEYP